MIFKRRAFIARILDLIPGKRLLGPYRIMPVFFMLGALLEFSMINWEAGQNKTNFYKTYKKKTVTGLAEGQLTLEENSSWKPQ